MDSDREMRVLECRERFWKFVADLEELGVLVTGPSFEERRDTCGWTLSMFVGCQSPDVLDCCEDGVCEGDCEDEEA